MIIYRRIGDIMELKKIKIKENNQLVEYDVLFTIKDEEKNKEFIIYTDVNRDVDIYAALYNKKENKIEYIDDSEDQKMIEEVIKNIKEKMS
jgi:uncharacterized protein YrzB (UPF0473 family)